MDPQSDPSTTSGEGSPPLEDAWTDELARVYAKGMEVNVRHDHRRWAGLIAQDLRANATLPEVPVVVDVASGPGFLLLELAPLLPGARLVATDESAVMMRLAAERAQARGVSMQTRVCPSVRLDLPDASAHVLTAKHYLRLAADRSAFLAEAHRVIRPGGHLYVVDFNREVSAIRPLALWAWIRVTGGEQFATYFRQSYKDTALPASQVPATLRDAGFDDVRTLASGLSFLIAARRP